MAFTFFHYSHITKILISLSPTQIMNKTNKKIPFYILVAGIIVVLIITFALSSTKHQKTVTNFSECVATGYPVTGNPEKCQAPDSQVFIRDLSKDPKEISFQEILQGQDSGITQRQQKVITTPEYWSALWSQMFPGKKEQSYSFENKTIIAIFLGEQPSAGYKAHISKILEREDYIEVQAEDIVPGKGCINAQYLTYPYYIVQTQRIEKSLKFTFTKEVTNC